MLKIETHCQLSVQDLFLGLDETLPIFEYEIQNMCIKCPLWLQKYTYNTFSEELKSQYTLLVKLLDREFIFQPGQTDQVSEMLEKKYLDVLRKV